MTLISTEPATAHRHAMVLVAEDDGPSGQFFKSALENLGCRVTLASDGLAALGQARGHCFDLLLLDCRMPGASALRILTHLRTEPDAASHAAPAIATSAELGATQRRKLQQAGFADALAKPVSLAALDTCVRPLLPTAVLLLDDQAALQSSGSPDAVSALRGLFATELRRLANELDMLADRPDALAERLHRLLASCGFCGADALADASRRLKQAVQHHASPRPAELEHFRQVLVHTLQALDE